MLADFGMLNDLEKFNKALMVLSEGEEKFSFSCLLCFSGFFVVGVNNLAIGSIWVSYPFNASLEANIVSVQILF
jgi:hypothetical protein